MELFKDATISFNKTLELDPTDKDALINLGNCYMSLNDFERSVKTYLAAIKLDPKCVMSHYNLASAHHSAATTTTDSALAQKHFKNARAKFEAAIELNADYADAYFNLGETSRARGKTRVFGYLTGCSWQYLFSNRYLLPRRRRRSQCAKNVPKSDRAAAR